MIYALLAALAVVAPEREVAFVRGAMASLLALVAFGYALLLQPDYGPLYSLLEHAVTPLLIVADFLLVGRRPGRWWWPLPWAVLPIAYLGFHLLGDLKVYAFLDTSDPTFAGTIAALLVGFFVIAYALLGASRAMAGRGFG